MLKRLLLGLLVVWAGAGLLAELNGAVSSYDRRQRSSGLSAWRLGGPGPQRLARCLRAAQRDLPAGSLVAFASPDLPRGAAFERWRWAAYHLPAHDVVPADDPAALRTADYAIAFDRKIANPNTEVIRRLPDGWLYRVMRP